MFKRFGDRLAETPEQHHAQEIRLWCAELDAVEQIAECRPRTRRRVAGVVESIKVKPMEHTSVLEVQIFDGTDRIMGVWFGRQQIPGVDLGQRLILEGTMATFKGEMLQIINPAYEIVES
ncbi:MAG TPA: OB-fold nucleic acid binding domain-containing protein [Actinomycetota bacterium]|nr:OB-fold nucleic acid binding domain-containing protein [Actinomycetota bacterium]